MDRVATALLPYKDIIGSVAGYLTIAQFFSGVFICREIRKQGTTRNISALPFSGGVMVGLAMLKYGLMLQDPVMLQVNAFAIGLNTLYSIFYYIMSDDKWNQILKQLTYSLGFVAVLWGYCEWEDPSVLEFRYGLIVTLLMLLLLGSPLLDVKNIVAQKDASEIPFVLTVMGTLVTFMWLLYALVLKNNFMIVQNVVGFFLCFTQLILIFAYPGKPSKAGKKKKN